MVTNDFCFFMPVELNKGMTNEEVLDMLLRKFFPHVIFIRMKKEDGTEGIIYTHDFIKAQYELERLGDNGED